MTTYLVFSLDENGSEQYWKCFSDRHDAEEYLSFAFDDCWSDMENIGCCVRGNINDAHDYGCIEAKDGSGFVTEFFLMKIPESKILSTWFCCGESA